MFAVFKQMLLYTDLSKTSFLRTHHCPGFSLQIYLSAEKQQFCSKHWMFMDEDLSSRSAVRVFFSHHEHNSWGLRIWITSTYDKKTCSKKWLSCFVCHKTYLHCSVQSCVSEVLKKSVNLSSLDKGWSGRFTILLAWAVPTSPLGTHRPEAPEAHFTA